MRQALLFIGVFYIGLIVAVDLTLIALGVASRWKIGVRIVSEDELPKELQ